MPTPNYTKSLKQTLGLFSRYAKLVVNFSDKILCLKATKSFPISLETLQEYIELKAEIVQSSLHAINENCLFVVECAASEVATSATLNQEGRPVAFLMRTLRGCERHYPAAKKEAITTIYRSGTKMRTFVKRNRAEFDRETNCIDCILKYVTR